MNSNRETVHRHFTDEEISRANNVDLLSLAQSYGYVPENINNRKAIHMKRSGGLYIFPESNKFYHHTGSESENKGGAINFVMREEHISFGEAVAKLIGESSIKRVEPKQYTPQPREELILPPKAANFKRAYWYLVSVRGIEPDIVSYFMNEKKIYQDAEHSNTVFVGYDRDGTAKYCSMRACSPDSKFKRDADNSDKSYPFSFEGKSDLVIVNEAPIDLLSHASLTKLHGRDWKQDHRISLGCLSTAALDRYLDWHKEIKRIVFAFDNDYLARDKNGNLANWGQLAAQKALQTYSERGYVCAIHTPHLNDFNLQLTEIRKGRTIQEMDEQRLRELQAEFEKTAVRDDELEL